MDEFESKNTAAPAARSDLPAASWQVIEKIIRVRRLSKWDLKQIVNAVLYVTKNGCVWRDVPGEFPPWQTVYWKASPVLLRQVGEGRHLEK
ncbi:transposase, partial [Persicitalea sp.]|uniref:transposase n=1 Tax=Persicitalea sp. TaxID=3100273 RepID=UPI003593B191